MTFDFQRLAASLERRAARWQGKGWGLPIDKEVGLVLSAAPNAKVIFDVGANVGDWSAEIIKQAAPDRLFVFEPSAVNVRKLRARLDGNPAVAVIGKALSDETGKAAFFAPKVGSSLASLHKRRLDHFDTTVVEVEQVDKISFVDFVRDENITDIDILKLDIEGHEFALLSSIPDNLMDKISLIQFEFGGTNIDSRTFFQDFWYLLSGRFDIFRIAPHGLLKINAYREQDEFFSYTNYVCLRATP